MTWFLFGITMIYFRQHIMNSIKKNGLYSQRVPMVIILLISFLGSGCGHRLHKSLTYYNGYPKVDFCELMEHKNEVVYTQGAYSGIDEYWSFYSFDKKCKRLNVDLDIPPDINLKPLHEKLLKQVYENYYKTYLIIDAIGKFETGSEVG